MPEPIVTPAPTTVPAAVAPVVPDGTVPAPIGQAPEVLHDAAIAAVEAWQANAADEKLKEAAKTAVATAKEATAKAKAKVAEDAKKTADEAAKNVVPEKYKFVLPEKSLFNSAQMEKIAAFSKAQGFSQEKAQALVDAQHSLMTEFVTENGPGGSAWNKRLDEWEGQSLADPEVGGGNKEALTKNAELGKRVLVKFFDKEVADEIYRTGYGSHPGFLKGFIRIGKAMGEDTLVIPGPSPAGKKSMEDVFYGNPPKTV